MEKLVQGLGKPTVFLGGGGLRTQRVRWDETLAKLNPKLLSPHALYYTNIPWYTVPNGSARLQAVVSRTLLASAGILDTGGKQDDDIRNSFVGHQRGHSDSWLALLPEIMEE